MVWMPAETFVVGTCQSQLGLFTFYLESVNTYLSYETQKSRKTHFNI